MVFSEFGYAFFRIDRPLPRIVNNGSALKRNCVGPMNARAFFGSLIHAGIGFPVTQVSPPPGKLRLIDNPKLCSDARNKPRLPVSDGNFVVVGVKPLD